MECQQNQRLQRWLNCHNKAKSSYDRSPCYLKSRVSESLGQLGWAINQDMAPFFVIAAVTCVRDSAEKVSLLGRRNGLRITSWHCGAAASILGQASLSARRSLLRSPTGKVSKTSRQSVFRAWPNPSLKWTPNGVPPGPGWWYAVHFHQPGPRVTPPRST